MDYKNLYQTFAQYEELLEKDPKNKYTSPYKMLHRDFISDLVYDLSNTKLKLNEQGKISASETLAHMDRNVVYAVRIGYEFSRSKFLPVAAIKNPEYAAYTPLLMAAHKKYHEVAYEDWDKEDPHLGYVLGKTLEPLISDPIMQDIDVIYEQATPEKIAEWREISMPGRKITDYMARAFTVEIPGKHKFGKEDEIQLTKSINFKGNSIFNKMLLQTWICHATIRNTTTMILDPRDWDATPEAWDLGTAQEKYAAREKAAKENLPW